MGNKMNDMLDRKGMEIYKQKKLVPVHKINYKIKIAIDKEFMESIYTKNKEKLWINIEMDGKHYFITCNINKQWQK